MNKPHTITEDIKRRVLEEFENVTQDMVGVDYGLSESDWDIITKFISQALDTAFREWKEAVRMEKIKVKMPKKVREETIKAIDGTVLYPGISVEKALQDIIDQGYNQAVDELNKKLQELGK